VVLKTVSFQDKKGFQYPPTLLRAIDNNTLLSKLPKSEEGAARSTLCSLMTELYVQYTRIFRSSLRTAIDFARMAVTTSFRFCKVTILVKSAFLYLLCSAGFQALNFSKKLSYDGLHYRYKKPGVRIFNRIEKELQHHQRKRLCLLLS
jgi:hypothetical protein